MAVKLTRFDPADFLDDEADMLDDEADMLAHLADCAEDGDPALIAAALGAIARGQNMSGRAREVGTTRAGLSRALSSAGNPSFQTVSKVARAIGLKISVTPVVPSRKARAGRA